MVYNLGRSVTTDDNSGIRVRVKILETGLYYTVSPGFQLLGREDTDWLNTASGYLCTCCRIGFQNRLCVVSVCQIE